MSRFFSLLNCHLFSSKQDEGYSLVSAGTFSPCSKCSTSPAQPSGLPKELRVVEKQKLKHRPVWKSGYILSLIFSDLLLIPVTRDNVWIDHNKVSTTLTIYKYTD